VVLAAVLYVLVSGLVHGPGATPIGSAFAVGHPSGGKCWAAGVTNHVCGVGGNQLWNLSIDQSTVTVGSVLLEVKSSSGAVFKNMLAAGFALMPITGIVPIAYYSFAAGAGLAMTKPFTISPGYSSSTPITTTMYLVIGTGTPSMNWSPGQGNYVDAVGIGSFSGSTSAEVLP
jgi:hypothetical protein